MSDDFFDEKTIISPRTTPAGDNIDTTTDPLIGKRIGNYLVLSVLGRGGFGSIYKAEDTKLGRMVALKFLIQSDDEFHSELFEREAKALGKLSKHPHIVQIHTWDEHEGKNFFVLEYMDTSVADLLKQSPDGIAPDRAIQIIAECADALGFAHESCILHRDIKSPNILIECPDGKAKIADFGLARICGTSSNTIEGSIIGSPAYMAPELARGGEVTSLCDIYSLGATLHEMLSGKALFSGSSVLAVLEKVRMNERVELKTLNADLPPALYDVVSKATAHDPNDRYQTASELSEALRAIDVELLAQADTETKSKDASKKSPWLYLITGLALLFWAYMAYVFMGNSTDESALPPENEVGTPAIEPPTSAEAINEPEPVLEAMPEPEKAPAPETPAENQDTTPAEETADSPPAQENPTLKEEAVEVLRENKEEIVDSALDYLKNRSKKGNGKKKK